ncbi:MAG: Crp/Fnr family transcriptional regulator [Bdellovibrionales bacterium]
MKKTAADSVPSQKKNDCRECRVTGIARLCHETDHSLETIQEAKRTLILKKDESLKVPKQHLNSLFLVKSGMIKLRSEHEENVSLELLYRGSFFGGLGQFDLTDFHLKVEAACDSEICEIDETVIRELMSQDSHFLKRYMFFVGLYVNNLREGLAHSGGFNVTRLLARALQKDFKERGYLYGGLTTVTKVLSREEWALFLGSRPETVSRAFAELQKLKIIQVKSGSISLVDETALVRYLLPDKKTGTKAA